MQILATDAEECVQHQLHQLHLPPLEGNKQCIFNAEIISGIFLSGYCREINKMLEMLYIVNSCENFENE